jgi:hypothetical protein
MTWKINRRVYNHERKSMMKPAAASLLVSNHVFAFDTIHIFSDWQSRDSTSIHIWFIFYRSTFTGTSEGHNGRTLENHRQSLCLLRSWEVSARPVIYCYKLIVFHYIHLLHLILVAIICTSLFVATWGFKQCRLNLPKHVVFSAR